MKNSLIEKTRKGHGICHGIRGRLQRILDVVASKPLKFPPYNHEMVNLRNVELTGEDIYGNSGGVVEEWYATSGDAAKNK